MDAQTIAHYGWRVTLADDVCVADRRGIDATSRSRKVRAVIAILASTQGQRVARRDLIALLWSDRGAEQARASLRQCLFTLRSDTPALAEADGEWVWLGHGVTVSRDTDPATLARLSGLDPAFDRWLAARPGCFTGDTPAILRVAAINTVVASPYPMHRWAMVTTAAAILLAATMAWWWQHRLPGSGSVLTVIAITPFAAARGTPATAAIAERMSGDIRALLPGDRAVVRINDGVSGRTGKASRLGADWVISGNVDSESGSGRVQVRINTADGRQIWARNFDAAPGRLADVAAIAATRIGWATGCALGGPRVHRDVDVLGLLFVACDRLDFSADNYSDETALVALQRLAERAPDDGLAQAYYGTGLAVTAENMPPAVAVAQRIEAVRRLDRAQRLDARVGEAWLGRFALVADDRAYELQESILARGLAVEPNNVGLNVFMGELLANVGRGSEAMVVAQRAMALAPALLATTQLTAGLMSAAGRPREALALLDIADRRFPRNRRQAMQRLDALLTSGDTAAARTLLDHAAEIEGFLEPEREAAKRRLSYAMDQPHGALADAVAREAIAEADANPELAPRNFNVLAQLGRTDAALSLARRHPLPTSVFFRLQSRPVLLDRQFPVLAERAGLWTYWQHSGHWPDICREPQLHWRCGVGVKSASIPE